MSAALGPGERVLWADLGDGPYVKHGTVLREPVKAWTPNDLTDTAPDTAMVAVQWDGDTDPCWEYTQELAKAS